MDLITLDFETYYDKDISLRKMTTEEYIRMNPYTIFRDIVSIHIRGVLHRWR